MGIPPVVRLGGRVDERACGLEPGRHFGQLMRDGLEFLDRPAEGLPARRMLDGGIERGLRHTDNGSTDAWTEQIERSHRQLEPAIDLAQHLLLRYENPVQFE